MAIANGKIKSVFGLYVGGYDFVGDITRFRLYSEPLDQERITFGKYGTGTAVKWQLEISAVFDGGSYGSLHDYLWDNAGLEAEFMIKPFQDFDPLLKRFYRGTVRIMNKPDIMLTAGKTSTYNYTFKVIGQPSRSDSPSGFLTAGYYDDY